jgi:hypothetical protein
MSCTRGLANCPRAARARATTPQADLLLRKGKVDLTRADLITGIVASMIKRIFVLDFIHHVSHVTTTRTLAKATSHILRVKSRLPTIPPRFGEFRPSLPRGSLLGEACHCVTIN